ncbi:hypothetical protein DAI22_04g284936 [Oryza sativa Japonica Group]|nr:hypothetical protein DAI22_04g284936 [Oryza sativa Japonica Group]
MVCKKSQPNVLQMFMVIHCRHYAESRLGRHPEWKLHHLFGCADWMVIYGLSVLSRINRECPDHSCGCGRQYSTVVLVK